MNEILFAARTGENIPYASLIENVQQSISQTHSGAVAAGSDNEVLIKSYIDRYLINAGISVSGGSATEAVERIFQDIAGTGFLSEYLGKLKTLEDVNINAWDSAVVNKADGTQHYAESMFLSPEHADTVLTRMVKEHGGLLDASTPAAKVTIAKNTRMTIVKYPIVDKEVGFAASIRTVNTAEFTDSDLITEGTATDEELQFLLFCSYHGISVVFSGMPGVGKTAMAGMLLSRIHAEQQDQRIVTIEHETREFQFRKFGKDGRQNNDVVHMMTRPSEIQEQNYDMIRLNLCLADKRCLAA
jgi:Type IV secretory pathway, VirB11 components, and related ATPases involved in archaeal flagella biosynthesis